MDSPALKSTARLSVRASEKRKNEKGFGFQGVFLTLVLVLNLFLAVEFGFSWMVSGVLRPVLSPDIVRSVGERSCVVNDLNERMRFVTSELEGIVHSKVSNCSHNDSKWEINQYGLLLNSRCVLYKSATEEVSIWGWPLQTAGLLTAGFSSRSFSILSGRVTEAELDIRELKIVFSYNGTLEILYFNWDKRDECRALPVFFYLEPVQKIYCTRTSPDTNLKASEAH